MTLENTIHLQKSASNPYNSVFVSASAGSGKTRVLTNRVLRLLLIGATPSKILCLTFTKVAATEMKKRIFDELENWVILPEDELQNRLLDLTKETPSSHQIKEARKLFTTLLDDNYGLQISTIHSFCQSIIKKFPIEAKISPNFEVIDEQKENQLLIQSRKILLKNALSDENLAKQINLITSKLNEDSFLGITAEIIRKRQSLTELKEKYFNIEGIVEEIWSNVYVTKIKTCSSSAIFNNFIEDSNWQKNHLRDLCFSTEIKSKEAIVSFINNPEEDNLAEYLNVFLTTENEPRKTLTTKPIEKIYPNAKDIMLLEQKRVVEFLEIFKSAKIAEATSSLLLAVDKIIEIYSQIKAKNGYLDYSDLIIKTNALLENSANRDWIKYKLDGAVEHILVDESQDTNHHQWNIIKAISEEFFAGLGAGDNLRTVFVVGDEKQSIYSFQGADPNIFADIFYYYQEKFNQAGQNFLNIELAASFRSMPAILNAVDKVFSKPQYASAISVLAKQIKHNPLKTNFEGKVELMPEVVGEVVGDSENKADKEDKYRWKLDFTVDEEHNLQEILAENIAKKIKSFFDEEKFLASKNRKIEYGDIMILLKERQSNLGNLLIKHLQKRQIKVSGSDKIDLKKNIIIADLLSVAKFILLPQDDLNLACLLKSPIINLSEEDIFELCLDKNQKESNLWQQMQDSSNPKIKEKQQFLQDLITQNNLQAFCIYQFFTYLLIEKNGLELIELRFKGQAKDVVNQFLKICQNYQDNNIASSLEHFVFFILNSNSKIKIANHHNQNQVYITTVHGAKGLEAPIVFIADAIHSSQKQAGNDRRIFWDRKTNLPFWSLSAKNDNDKIKQIKDEEKASAKQEYLRQLYVAMTRAEEELYIAGYGEGSHDCWYNLVKDSLI
jgi:ATP-dependent helicase/nuclease subunit A